MSVVSPDVTPFQWNYGAKRKSDKTTGVVKKRRSKYDRAPLSNKVSKLDTHANKLLFKDTWNAQLKGSRPNKKRKTEQKSSMTMGTMTHEINGKSKRNNTSKNKPFRALFDSGSSEVALKSKRMKE